MIGRPWTRADDDTVRAMYQTHSAREISEQIGRTERAVYQRANDLGLRKTRDWIAERTRQAMLDPNHGGRRQQFQPGITPWNKGTHWAAGGASIATRFQPGHRGGRAQALWMPVGSLRINADGYLDRKVHDGLPLHTRWRAEHTLIWEAAHGAIPKGHAIIFKDATRHTSCLKTLSASAAAN